MALEAGTRLGPYEILSPLGAGGMGEVYRARDTRLDRIVALKVLPEPFAAQPELRQRFEREARAVSSLNHPHICALFDVGRQDGIDFLVMEYLEGETLADRLDKGPLPTDQTVRHGIEIADALDKAHRQGIVHRDLKPGNVMLTKSGAKLLDFGLVKVQSSPAAAAASMLSALVTAERPLTAHGVVLGTFQYMAPEQLEGKEADGRTDIFALGTILYEMATGRKAFVGKSQASLIAAILQAEPPPLSSLQPLAPAGLERLVKVCLAKDPDERLQTAHDVMQELKWIAESASGAGSSTSRPSRFTRRERLAWILAGLLAILAGGLALRVASAPAPPAPTARFEVSGPEGATYVGYPVLSPDGRSLAFLATVGGVTSVWVRPLDSLDARSLPGTEVVSADFTWSGDSRAVAFLVGDALQRVALAGGPPFTICRMKRMSLGDWSRQGTILFSNQLERRIYKVAASGGTPTAVTDVREGVDQLNPSFLPDERHFLFSTRGSRAEAINVASLDSPEVRELGPAESQAVYAPSGHLLFVRGGTLLAQPFDPRSRRLHGEPVPVADELVRERTWFYFSVSTTGTLAYTRQPQTPQRLTWFDRGGRALGTLGEPGQYASPEIAPDGRRVVFVSRDAEFRSNDIVVLDLERGGSQRVTPEPGPYFAPLWSSDGRSIFFGAGLLDQKPGRVLRRASDGTGSEEVVFEDDGVVRPTDISPDGRLLAYFVGFQGAYAQRVRALPPTEQSGPFERTEAMGARFSPDGRWLAYLPSGSELRIEPHPPTGARWQVGSGWIYQPRWRRDGRELFYLTGDGTLMAVDTVLGSAEFRAGTPRALFQTPVENPWAWGPNARNMYDVAPDGKRFLFTSPVGRRGPAPMTVILNWAPERAP